MKQTLSVTLTFTIDSVLTFQAATLPHGLAGTEYPSTSIGTISGGIGPYTFSVVDGLPEGMALSTDGVLSGTPVVAGDVNLHVQITDSGV